MTKEQRLPFAQAILTAFAPHVRLSLERGRCVFEWEGCGGKLVRRQWQARGESHYPVWYSIRPFGGTGCVACWSLVMYLRTGELALHWWHHVTGESVGFPKATLDRVYEAEAAERPVAAAA